MGEKDSLSRRNCYRQTTFNSDTTVILEMANRKNAKLVCPSSGNIPNGTQFVFMHASENVGWWLR